VKYRWTQASRKHRIGRAHALHVMATATGTPATTARGEPAVLWVGPDDRGLELEGIAVRQPDQLLIIHVMPTALRKETP
jgi:hypothetical protein